METKILISYLKKIVLSYQDIFHYNFDTPDNKPNAVKYCFVTINTIPLLFITNSPVNKLVLILAAILIQLLWGVFTFIQQTKAKETSTYNFRFMLISAWIAITTLCITFFKLFDTPDSLAALFSFVAILLLLFMHLYHLSLTFLQKLYYFISISVSICIFLYVYRTA